MLLPLADARARLLALVSPADRPADRLPAALACGRIAAADILAPLSLPPFDNSAVDGYGVRLADLDGMPGTLLPLGGRAAAGHTLDHLPPGHAARILTGAVVPPGTEAVVMQEDCQATPEGIRFGVLPPPGDNIRRAGEDIAAGEVAIPAGTRLTPARLALLASLGITEVLVRQPVRVGVISTGDEIVPAGQPLRPGQIHDSNRPVIFAFGAELGAEMVDLGHVGDSLEETIAALASAKTRDCDMVITLGGASVGDADFVKPAVEALGRLDFWRIALKPGKPIAFGAVQGIPFLGLPGNPGATQSGFLLLGAPLIRRLQGRPGRLFPVAQRVASADERTTGEKRDELVACRLDDDARAVILPGQGSGNLRCRADAEGLALLPKATTIRPGDVIEWYSYPDLLA